VPGLVGRGPFRGAFDARAWPLPISTAAPAEQGHCACAGGLRRGAQSVRPRPMPAARGRNVRAVAKAQPQCRADGRSWVRCEVCDQGHWGARRRPLPLDRYSVRRAGAAAEGYTGELAEARSRAEEALGAYFAVSANDPWTDADAPHSPPKHLANPSAATPELKATNKTTSAPFLPQSNLVGSH